MVVGLLGNKSPDSNRLTLVTPKSENDVRLQAKLGNQNPTGLPVGIVSCKHMIALDLGIFPEKEQQMMEYIEEQNQLYEQEYEKEMQEREEEIREYVMKSSKAELRQLLIQRMVDDLYD